MSFKINSLYLTDGYKVGHKAMLFGEGMNNLKKLDDANYDLEND